MNSKLNLLVLVLMICASLSFAGNAPDFQLSGRFAIAGDGGWDYITFDPDGNRVFIARATHVQVVDAASGKLLGALADTPGVHGVAIAADLGVGAISNGKGNRVSLFNLKSLQKTAEIKAGNKPDAIIYDAFTHHVIAFNGKSQDATVIDPAKGAAVATIPLQGAPEFAASDLKGHVFVNLEDKNELVKIDVQKNSVLARWPLIGCDSPTGLALDRKSNRVFSVCANQVMTVADGDTGKIVAKLAIGQHPDAASFDPELNLAFSSNGDGTLTVVHEDSPDKYSVVQNVATARGARTMALDVRSHKVFLVTSQFGPAPAPTPEHPEPRPPMTPGTFELLVVTQK